MNTFASLLSERLEEYKIDNIIDEKKATHEIM
jgi:hypothetical protein